MKKLFKKNATIIPAILIIVFLVLFITACPPETGGIGAEGDIVNWLEGTVAGSACYSTGNVGIGTDAPGAVLAVAGDVTIASTLEVGGQLSVGSYTFPSTDGTAGYVLKTNGSGVLSWQQDDGGASGDNLGNHTATQNILLGSNYLSGDGGNEGISVDTDGNVGIGSVSPEFQLSMYNDGGIIATGTFNAGNYLTTSGPGTRMFWYPRKAAFRAGYVDGNQWNDANIAYHSTAFGYSTTADGEYSTALGFYSTTGGGYSVAMGHNTTADGVYTVAMGNGTLAEYSAAVAMGDHTTATGYFTTAMGYYTTAESCGSLVIGRYNEIAGYIMDWNDTDPAFVIGNGTGTSDRSNAFEVRKDGQVSVNGVVVHASDERLKENIEELTYGIDEILQLRPVTYNWKRYPENGRNIGLVAQDVKDVLPELVSTDRSEHQYLNIDYTNIIPVLINGIKELKAENDELKARIEALESE